MDIALYNKIKVHIHQLLGINLDYYKDEQMRRRLDSWLVRSGLATWELYFEKVKADPAELQKFRNYLTINVTEFFRDIERWNYLKQNILPDLLQQSARNGKTGLRIWSAGCSVGAEPYTLSMILEDLSPNRKHYLLATDLDQGALEKARHGGPYLPEEIKSVTPAQRSAFFQPGGPPFLINDTLKKKITFKEHNLLQSAYEGDFDLIVCRNVVIYFTQDTKNELYKKFHDSLRTGGIMFVGGTEIIPRPQEIGFKGFGISFYSRV